MRASPALRSQARNRGTGESVANCRNPGRSRCSATTTCLISALPKLMPRSPGWVLEIE